MDIDFRCYRSCVFRQYEDARGAYDVRQLIFFVSGLLGFFFVCIFGQVLLSQLITEQ